MTAPSEQILLVALALFAKLPTRFLLISQQLSTDLQLHCSKIMLFLYGACNSASVVYVVACIR